MSVPPPERRSPAGRRGGRQSSSDSLQVYDHSGIVSLSRESFDFLVVHHRSNYRIWFSNKPTQKSTAREASIRNILHQAGSGTGQAWPFCANQCEVSP